MTYIKVFSEIHQDDIASVGGKGLSLGRLIQAGIPVPDGFVVATDAYKKYGAKGADAELIRAIMEAFDTLGVERVAVRSSAIAEDSPEASWAGQFESYLNVPRDQVIQSVVKCWESASSAIVDAYAETQSTTKDELVIAVVVQKMVDSEVSGVAFSVNPISKNENEIMIEAIYGLGELLVQGMITPDNYVIQKNNLEIIQENVQVKPKMLVFEQNENIEMPVPTHLQSESCLTADQLVELAELTKRIEAYYQVPQDIEWAFSHGNFSIVQSRPITTL